MNRTQLLYWILALILFPAIIAGPLPHAETQVAGFSQPASKPPAALQGLRVATVEWRAGTMEPLGLSAEPPRPGLPSLPDWIGTGGDQVSCLYGQTVGTAGDVNGDGFDDVIVGAPYYNNGTYGEGAAAVYYGSPSGLSPLPDWMFESNILSSLFGYSVGTAGDVNGDGFDDVIVGAPDYQSTDVEEREGAAAVFFGSETGLSSLPGWFVQSNNANARFGFAVGTAGDVNGDGFDDVIVGAPDYQVDGVRKGAAAVYLGSASGLPATPDWWVVSDQTYSSYGISVGTAGDVNGDGFAEVIVGAPYYHSDLGEGAAAVYNGSAAGLALVPSWVGRPDQHNSNYGWSVGTAGDVNGDGFDDVIVGARSYSNGEDQEGAAAVYFGSASGLSRSPRWVVEGGQDGAHFGFSVGTAGDINDDGYADVIIGAPLYNDGEASEGGALVYYGSPSGLSRLPGWSNESNQVEGQFGHSVGTAGDVNGDGHADIIVGSPYYSFRGQESGAAAVYQDSGFHFLHLPAMIRAR